VHTSKASPRTIICAAAAAATTNHDDLIALGAGSLSVNMSSSSSKQAHRGSSHDQVAGAEIVKHAIDHLVHGGSVAGQWVDAADRGHTRRAGDRCSSGEKSP